MLSGTFPLRVVYCWRLSSENSIMALRGRSSAPALPEEGEEVSELGASGASVVTPGGVSATAASATVASLSSIAVADGDFKTVWDFENITKHGGPDPFSKYWKCGWCGMTLKGWNATKAMNHAAKALGNNDVKSCSGNIPKATLSLFQAFRYKKIGAASLKRQHQEAFTESVSDNQKSLSVMFEAQRCRASKSSSAGNRIDLNGDVEASNSTRLTSAIAEFVFCKGLAFSTTEGEHFMQILKLACLVGGSYRPPTRKVLANELLKVSYENRLERYMRDLDVDADVYGLTLFGDGATVHGMPLMNILATGVGEPCAVLSIVDCKFVFCFLFLLITDG